MNYFEEKICGTINELKQNGSIRQLRQVPDNCINLSSNDYLGLNSRSDKLYKEFFENILNDFSIQQNSASAYAYPVSDSHYLLSSTSSRLLTGNYPVYEETEQMIAGLFGKESALIFGSGYQMNIGILPAITDSNTLILADKLVHASIIDGIRLCSSKCIRYRHQDYKQLAQLIEKNISLYSSIIIVTESIFSMDGDVTNLNNLVELKKHYNSRSNINTTHCNILLYVDEAHAIGVRGKRGLGLAEEQNCIEDIDFLCGTLGKAIASTGAYIVCSEKIREFLVNRMRSFIFTTALPPLNISWTKFVLGKIEGMQEKREYLDKISRHIIKSIKSMGKDCISESHIIPFTLGSNEKAIKASQILIDNGFYVLPIRHPTVPAGTERLRISLNASLSETDVERLIKTLQLVDYKLADNNM